MKSFLKFFRNKAFLKQKTKFMLKVGYFLKMTDIASNKRLGLLTIPGCLLMSQEHIKERNKTKTMGTSFDEKER